MSLSEKNIEIANKWFAAFNEYHLENLLSLYSETAEHKSPKLKIRQPETHGLVRGKSELRNWWNDSFTRIPSLKYIPLNILANDKMVMMEYLRKADGDEDMLVSEILEIENGLIVRSRVFHG